MAILFSFSHYMTLSTDAYEINRDSIFNENKKKMKSKPTVRITWYTYTIPTQVTFAL